MPDPKLYKRREFDSKIHCGHFVDRDPESMRKRLEGYEAKLAEFDALGRELTIQEKKHYARKGRMAHFMRLGIQKIERDGPDDRPCIAKKGSGTDHPGVGLCRFHCACKGRPDGHLSYYSRRAKDQKLQGLIDEMDAAGHDILDLTPELLMLRAKMKLFLDEKVDFDPETVKSLTLIQEQLRKTIETVNNKRYQTMLSRETFDLILMRMAEALMEYVTDPEILEKIQLRWSKISVETSAKRGRITEHAN